MRNYHFAFLLLFQSLIACQQVQENGLSLAAGLANSSTDARQDPGKAPPSAANLIFQSLDGGQTWQDVSAGLPKDLEAGQFFAGNDELFLGVEYRMNRSNTGDVEAVSGDSVRTSTRLATAASADVKAVSGDSARTEYEFEYGMYRSNTASTTPVWEKEIFLGEGNTAVFLGQGGLFACIKGERFFRKINGTSTWMPMFTNFDDKFARTILETPDGIVLVGCDNGIFKTTDYGKTWKHVLDEGWVIQIVESGGVLICTNEQGILRSTDGGEHWDVVISEGGVGIAVERIEGGFAAITYNTGSKTRRVRTSTDGGITWQPIDAGLPPSPNIASIKQVGKYFFCGHPKGIFRSSDRGNTWELLLPSIGKKVFNLSVSGNVIYAVPRNEGC